MPAKLGLISELRYSMSMLRDRRPGFLHVGEGAAQEHVDDAHLGGGEFAAFDLRVAADAAEEVVDHREHELRIEHEQRRCRAAG